MLARIRVLKPLKQNFQIFVTPIYYVTSNKLIPHFISFVISL